MIRKYWLFIFVPFIALAFIAGLAFIATKVGQEGQHTPIEPVAELIDQLYDCQNDKYALELEHLGLLTQLNNYEDIKENYQKAVNDYNQLHVQYSLLANDYDNLREQYVNVLAQVENRPAYDYQQQLEAMNDALIDKDRVIADERARYDNLQQAIDNVTQKKPLWLTDNLTDEERVAFFKGWEYFIKW